MNERMKVVDAITKYPCNWIKVKDVIWKDGTMYECTIVDVRDLNELSYYERIEDESLGFIWVHSNPCVFNIGEVTIVV